MKIVKVVRGFFGRLSDLFRQASRSKQQAKKIEQLAKQRQLQEAVTLTQEVIDCWSLHPSLSESLIRKVRLGKLIERLETKLKHWQSDLDRAESIAVRAQNTQKEDSNDPYNPHLLLEAKRLYQNAKNISDEPRFTQAITEIERELAKRQKFQRLMSRTKREMEDSFYQQALDILLEAKQLYSIEELKAQIALCQAKSREQSEYESVLTQTNEMAQEGRFAAAIALFEPALAKFYRADGKRFLSKLQQVASAKNFFRIGLMAENQGIIGNAIAQYNEALKVLPEVEEFQIRLAIAYLKNNELNQSLSLLKLIDSERADYLRGLIYAKQKDWQSANREWRRIGKISIEFQRSVLKGLADRDRLVYIKEIELAVDSGKLSLADTLSQEFSQKFGLDVVRQNLDNHIKPLLEQQIWQGGNWQQIANKTEQAWIERQNLKSLHNWAIASYYWAQADPSKLSHLIIAWATALANINSDPALQSLAWLDNSSIDREDVATKLQQILENAIDAVKDNSINEYLKLRDIYRREMVALSLVRQDNCGVRIKQQIFILPGCYQRCRHLLSNVNLPSKIWGALYTDWGTAVAACYKNDIARAIKIKPGSNPNSSCDRFASNFVAYHEGSYHLQNLDWRKAVKPLQQTQSEIKTKSDWQRQIDKLSETQRQKIDNFDEHLAFSQFWYKLLDSQTSRSYYVECQARNIAKHLADETLSSQKGLERLRELQDIDRHNPVVLELIKAIKTIQESEEVDRLLKQRKFEEAVNFALRSQNEDVRFRLAELCLEVILKQLQEGSLSHEAIQGLNQIAQWAYELCPREPEFQPVFEQLREIGIRC